MSDTNDPPPPPPLIARGEDPPPESGTGCVISPKVPPTPSDPPPPRSVIVSGEDRPPERGYVILPRFPPIPLYETLLVTARNLIGSNEFSVAVVVAHMACEVKVARVLTDSFQAKGLTHLEEAVVDLLPGYNLANKRIRNVYNAIKGDDIHNQPFWAAFVASAERRNKVTHEGLIVNKEEAEASLKVARELVDYLQ